MARKKHTRTPRTITLRASHGRGLINIPIKIFCESNSVSATDHSQAAGRDLHATHTATEHANFLREILTEKDKRISELKEYICELKDRLNTTPRPDLDAVEVETATHLRQ